MTPETPQSSERIAGNRRLLPFLFDLVEKVSLGRVLPFAWLVFGALAALGMWGPEKYRDVFICLWMGQLCGLIAYLRASTHQAEIEQLNDAAGCAWWVVVLLAFIFMMSPPHLGYLETVGLVTLVFWSVRFSCHLGIKFRFHHHRKTKGGHRITETEEGNAEETDTTVWQTYQNWGGGWLVILILLLFAKPISDFLKGLFF